MLIAGRQSARGSRARKLKKKPPVLDYNSIGEPTFMLSVRGVSSSALQQYIATTNKSLQLPPSAAMELSLINGPTSHVRDNHVSVYICVNISPPPFVFLVLLFSLICSIFSNCVQCLTSKILGLLLPPPLPPQVVSGAPHLLTELLLDMMEVSAAPGDEQSRVPFSQRKPHISGKFLNISAPYHCSVMEGALALFKKDVAKYHLPGLSFQQLQLPVHDTRTSCFLWNDFCVPVFLFKSTDLRGERTVLSGSVSVFKNSWGKQTRTRTHRFFSLLFVVCLLYVCCMFVVCLLHVC
jgi:hypothetical protein